MADGVSGLSDGQEVSRTALIALLAFCALLEAGGDALIRKGILAGTGTRIAFYGAGAAVLFFYGWLVNRTPWNFGELLGLYVAVFFVVAQILAVLVFREKVTPPILAGGALIVTGGLVITFWR
ncbi:MAG: hypothetical protein EBY17_06315 [Acidobacteriia bacterium]|nr:hypothetical protein [Terriglobia bacterium]